MFHPLHNRFTARELPETHSTIIFPDAYQPKPKTAEVVDISLMQELSVKPGDVVHIGRHVKQTVPHIDDTLLLVEEGDIQLVNGRTHADRILIEPEIIEKIGSIILADISKPKPSRGKILDHGPKTGLKVNQWVHFEKEHGMPIEIDGKKLIIMKDCDILGVEE